MQIREDERVLEGLRNDVGATLGADEVGVGLHIDLQTQQDAVGSRVRGRV